MHAGVSAAGADHGQPFSGNLQHRPLELSLHRRAALQTLPAAEGSSIVLDDEFYVAHGYLMVPRTRERGNAGSREHDKSNAGSLRAPPRAGEAGVGVPALPRFRALPSVSVATPATS